jgi:hypothetical protein
MVEPRPACPDRSELTLLEQRRHGVGEDDPLAADGEVARIAQLVDPQAQRLCFWLRERWCGTTRLNEPRGQDRRRECRQGSLHGSFRSLACLRPLARNLPSGRRRSML